MWPRTRRFRTGARSEWRVFLFSGLSQTKQEEDANHRTEAQKSRSTLLAGEVERLSKNAMQSIAQPVNIATAGNGKRAPSLAEPPTPGDWPEIEPLEDERTAPKPFPIESLPNWLQAYVGNLQRTFQTPLDLPAMLALGAFSVALQGRVVVWIPTRNWKEPVALYITNILRSGSKKTMLINEIFAPAGRWEKHVQEQEARAVSDSAQEAAEIERSMQKANDLVAKRYDEVIRIRDSATASDDQKRAAEADLDTAREEAKAQAYRHEMFKKQPKFRLLFEDATPEIVAHHLAVQKHHHVAFVSDEGDVFDVLLGKRYQKANSASNLNVFLKGHPCTSLRIDRIGREPEEIERVAMNMDLAVQHATMKRLGADKEMAGRGGLARFLYSMPAPPQTIDPTAVPIDPALRANFADAFDNIADAARDLDELKEIQMTPDALERFEEWYTQRCWAYEPPDEESEDEASGYLSWDSKLNGHILRLAAVIAAARIRGMPEEITLEDINAAIGLEKYLADHARRTFSVMSDTNAEIRAMRHIVRFIFKHPAKAPFKTSDIVRGVGMRRLFPKDTSEQTEEMLKWLARAGYVRQVTKSTRPPRYHWEVNPKVYTELNEEDLD